MFPFRFTAALGTLLTVSALLVQPAFASRVHRAPTSGQTHRTHKLAKKTAVRRVRGQQGIDPERATQIQHALIREHYLTGDPSGQWDAATAAAMQKYQADQGWQTKIMPDSRALKKLGLGPDYSSAINAKTSSFSPQPSTGAAPADQTAGFATASGVNQ